MSARILQFDKRFLDCVDSGYAGFTAVFPPPRSREIDPGFIAKLGQRERIKRVQALHESFIKEMPVMGVAKQWADSFHLFSSLARTQFLLLTYPYGWFYTTCVSAISQQANYGSTFMRYTKALETDTLVRDATLVNELHNRYMKAESARNEITFRGAQDWFFKKHQCSWQEHVKIEERQH